MSIDLTKPLQTREGNPVRLLASDGAEPYPIIGLVSYPSGGDKVERWTSDGQYYIHEPNHEEDLVNAPERVTRYANIYGTGGIGSAYGSRKECDHAALSRRIGVVEIVFEGEEGDRRLVSVTVV